MSGMHTGCRPDSFLGVEREICGLDLVYTLFVGSFYTVDLSQSHFGSFVYAHASDWFFSFLSHMFCPSLSFKTFGMLVGSCRYSNFGSFFRACTLDLCVIFLWSSCSFVAILAQVVPP